jgi:hypothetical protein
MARYMVRVELHAATEAHYQKLHDLMAVHGLMRYIDKEGGGRCWLPPAEYTIVSSASANDVKAMAKVCAAALGLRFAVVVTEAVIVIWEGLQAA